MRKKTFKTVFIFSGFIICLFFSNSLTAQFGGGTGSEEDPYRIYSKEHLEELQASLSITVDYSGLHFSLMNDIIDSLRSPIGRLNLDFNGNFHGHGHTIRVALDYRNDSYYYTALFMKQNTQAYLDSLTVEGYIYAMSGIVFQNSGIIYSCINKAESFHEDLDFLATTPIAGGICRINQGSIESCINFSTIHGYNIGGICGISGGNIINCDNYGNIRIFNSQGNDNIMSGGVCYLSSGIISGCKNFGFFEFTGQELIVGGGGICGKGDGLITFCQNFANLSGKIDNLGGIVGSALETHISFCSNYGSVDGWNSVGGIVGDNFSWGSSIDNCFNSGNVSGLENVAGIFGNRYDDTITNCLNIGLCNGSAITCLDITGLITHNYYDKQMCLIKGIAGVDVPNSAEGKLTTQLTGTSPELQAMLGDGWSYGEGRYPIPLGLENDSMALVAATPVYLHFETEEDYNHVDSVCKNFTVTTDVSTSSTNVAFDWSEANGRVSFSDENVTLLSLGIENLTVSLGDYSKKVRINIIDIEVSATQQRIENGIFVYPNPAGDCVYLSLNGVKADKVEIYDITGKLLSSNNLSSSQTQIFTGNLNSGLYLLKVYNRNTNIATLKFAKN